jgi:hypothetical protein
LSNGKNFEYVNGGLEVCSPTIEEMTEGENYQYLILPVFICTKFEDGQYPTPPALRDIATSLKMCNGTPGMFISIAFPCMCKLFCNPGTYFFKKIVCFWRSISRNDICGSIIYFFFINMQKRLFQKSKKFFLKIKTDKINKNT